MAIASRRWSVGKPSVLIPISAAPVHRDAPKQGVGDGYHLHSDLAGLALPGRGDGSVLAQDRRLVGRPDDSSGARAERGADGRASTTSARHRDSLGSGHPVRQRRMAAVLPLQSSRTEHEPKGNCWDNAVADRSSVV